MSHTDLTRSVHGINLNAHTHAPRPTSMHHPRAPPTQGETFGKRQAGREDIAPSPKKRSAKKQSQARTLDPSLVELDPNSLRPYYFKLRFYEAIETFGVDAIVNWQHEDAYSTPSLLFVAMRAARDPYFWVIDRLIEMGSDVNAEGYDPRTGLRVTLTALCAQRLGQSLQRRIRANRYQKDGPYVAGPYESAYLNILDSLERGGATACEDDMKTAWGYVEAAIRQQGEATEQEVTAFINKLKGSTRYKQTFHFSLHTT